jgi:hypothetical protein
MHSLQGSSKFDLESGLKKHGFKSISKYKKSTDPITVECLRCGRIRVSTHNKISGGRIKCQCQKEKIKLERLQEKLEECRKYAKSRGGLCLSFKISTTNEKLKWKCQKGHSWEAKYSHVLRQKTWCPACAGMTPRTIGELKAVAEGKGGKLLSRKYKGTEKFNYEFECSLGHRFSNRYRHVVDRGQWCPTCNKGSKSEEMARVAFEHLFQFQFKKTRPRWLRNSRGHQMEIDGYCPELRIGFEYQGIQHFEPKGIWSSKRGSLEALLKERIADDKLKAKLCKEHEITLFILDYTTPYESYASEIVKQLKEFDLPMNLIRGTLEIDFSSAYIRDDRLHRLRELLADKEIEVLSKKWISTKTKYDLLCRKCGHKWQAQGSAFFNSRSIAGCFVCARKASGEKQRGNIEDLQLFAENFGGIVLSKRYTKRNAEYKFRCRNNHTFVANYNNLAYRKQFCPICEKRQTRKKNNF